MAVGWSAPDFFSEDHAGFTTREHGQSYDLVVGNAPFGAKTVTDLADTWAKSDGRAWPIPSKDIGGLFLAKGGELLSSRGRVALIQSANTLLFNIGTATRFREQLFTRYRIETICNLSALRFGVFGRRTSRRRSSVAPVCVIVLNNTEPAMDDTIEFISPKQIQPLVHDSTIVIEPQDRQALKVGEAIGHPAVWANLMWGGPRDLQLLGRLSRFPTLDRLGSEKRVVSRQGVELRRQKETCPRPRRTEDV